MSDARAARPSSAAPTWWIVLQKELQELWIGGKALNLILVYTVLLGVLTWVLATNSELSLIPPKEMVFELVQTALAVGVFISLIVGADGVSGERERATLEGLLLTPSSRRQVVIGKFLASVSPWPVALLVAVPYMKVLSQGDGVFLQAVIWGGLFGSLLAPAFAALGMFVSYWCNSNKNSLFVSLGLYVACLIPANLPGRAQTGFAGRLLQWVNPMQAPNFFLEKILVNNRTFDELAHWLITPVVFAALMVALVLAYAHSGTQLEAGKPRILGRAKRRLARAAAALGLFVAVGASAAQGQQGDQQAAGTTPLQIAIDATYQTIVAGTAVEFHTVVTNGGAEPSPSLIVAMNIINLNRQGDVVDPEDWSPQRTQYLDPLAPGQTETLSWRVNPIFDGNYMVYMVLMPQPAGADATSQPVASSGIHLTVTPSARLNPRGILPYAIGGPVLVLVGIVLVYRRRRRGLDAGGQ